MSLNISRRGLLGAGLALTVSWRTPALAAAPVVTMHGDRLWLDKTGKAKAYRPPAGYAFAYSATVLDARAYF